MKKFYAQFQEIEPATDYRRLNFRIRKPDIRNLRFRFALRQVIVLTPLSGTCLPVADKQYLLAGHLRIFYDDTIYGIYHATGTTTSIWNDGRHCP